jgi:hypothetical protein
MSYISRDAASPVVNVLGTLTDTIANYALLRTGLASYCALKAQRWP